MSKLKPVCGAVAIAFVLVPGLAAAQTAAPMKVTLQGAAPGSAVVPVQAGSGDAAMSDEGRRYAREDHHRREHRRDHDDDDDRRGSREHGRSLFGWLGFGDRDDCDRGGKSAGPAAVGTVAPPSNGLFAPGAKPQAQVN
ncbi:hypothetical protein [Phaeovulum vinaykumarii]|uniref:Uncharacterized protein n=1 Tax=Phaeovulum vinaykumarii TaxID=407234 RepID=A0A1N7M7Z7_9RHOB|nr:hypothetical protein [Phaeovulum vinaykumarii]SIS82207.1 hypothetical protein SAMN05421795_10638 [Phaeovulum vinaykumarii]SOC11133.1 hypothetical protein SAMN05878426_106152 [Phaeovulum vinaykumarii]